MDKIILAQQATAKLCWIAEHKKSARLAYEKLGAQREIIVVWCRLQRAYELAAQRLDRRISYFN
jgi:hypothetical protein